MICFFLSIVFLNEIDVTMLYPGTQVAGRPHEILKLRIRDVVFKMAGDKQYAEVLVNGKTGSRHIIYYVVCNPEDMNYLY